MKTTWFRPAAALALAGAALASQPASAEDVSDWFPGHQGTFTFSEELLGAFQIAQIELAPVGGADWVSPDVSGLPLVSVSIAELDTLPDIDVTSFALGGGLRLSMGVTPFGGPGFAQFENFTYDSGSQTVYADVSGANGVVASQVALFLASSTPTWELSGALTPGYELRGSLGGLLLTNQGASVLQQGLGLDPLVVSILASAPAGSLSVAPIPEPSTWLLTGLGFVAVAGAMRRRH